MDKRYDIDFDKLADLNTPDELRTADGAAWFATLLKPFKYLHLQLLRFCDATIYDLLITGQVCSLERMLNDRYDFTQRRIYIDDGQIKPTRYIYQRAELKPVFIRKRAEQQPYFIYSSGESAANADKFVVYVPITINVNITEMISLIKTKRLSGKRFKIQFF